MEAQTLLDCSFEVSAVDPDGKKFDRVKGWRESFMKARAVMGMRGFVAMNGQSAQGKALYAKTKSFYSA